MRIEIMIDKGRRLTSLPLDALESSFTAICPCIPKR